MGNEKARPQPPDAADRERALDTRHSVLVQAPAGSGKTTLLTQRFLALLEQVNEPGEIVAITFTKAAAAEMRNRILDELRRTEPGAPAQRVLARSRALGWNLLEMPSQLRIDTIDAFCRELALQQPLVTQLGSRLDVATDPDDLYRRAAQRTLAAIDGGDAALREALEALLLWRDNDWQGLEEQLTAMLAGRDRWMHGFVLEGDPDWDQLRARLERPFVRAAQSSLAALGAMLHRRPELAGEALVLARYACQVPGPKSPRALAECAELPHAPFVESLESVHDTYAALAEFLLTGGKWRSARGLNKNQGFPAGDAGKAAKVRFGDLLAKLDEIEGMHEALAAVSWLPPPCYSEDDWRIVRACFVVLRRAAAELRILFAETGVVDFVEVAQAAVAVLDAPDGQPSDAAIAAAGRIRHLLVDEFQDTSRRQHELLQRLMGAWGGGEGRTCFVVGDPMQSIYSFRDAEAELFAQVRDTGMELAGGEKLTFDFVPLRANFRTVPELMNELNRAFAAVFAKPDGSCIQYANAQPARDAAPAEQAPFELHLGFVPARTRDTDGSAKAEREAACAAQMHEIVEVIRARQDRMERARDSCATYRIAVLARSRTALRLVAEALHEAAIPFRAVELEPLCGRPEVLDALALARAWMNPMDRVAWLGVLRAPWCGLSLADLHTLASADDEQVKEQPIRALLAERAALLSREGQAAVARLIAGWADGEQAQRATPTATLGTRLEQLWLCLGGAACVDAAARANLDLLWRSLDGLAGDEVDLLGSALDAALKKLTAQPDPAVSNECGVQLMTIHKAKGLEFEVVLVPELHAADGKSAPKLLSWLERGLQTPDENGEVTEFLVAPLQTKGAEKGGAKQWVDHVYCERERQEKRRILYVAATRARDELHLFARPEYKETNEGLALAAPGTGLLATAWPALGEEIERRFAEFATEREARPEETVALAAAEENILEMPRAATPTRMRRLPQNLDREESPARAELPKSKIAGSEDATRLFERHDGGLVSRALGTAVHSLLQQLARLSAEMDWDAARIALLERQPRVLAQVRSAGIELATARTLAAQALRSAIDASHDPMGRWLLSPHPEAASEVTWAGVLDGKIRVVRVDRVFRGSDSPQQDGDDAWWIVDYKTTHQDSAHPEELLATLHPLFAPQLEAYARVLRALHGTNLPLRAGLYYPRMGLFDWWKMEGDR